MQQIEEISKSLPAAEAKAAFSWCTTLSTYVQTAGTLLVLSLRLILTIQKRIILPPDNNSPMWVLCAGQRKWIKKNAFLTDRCFGF